MNNSGFTYGARIHLKMLKALVLLLPPALAPATYMYM